MPKISIIIPFFNAEMYISKTIQCLIQQTLDEIEIIMVDDGSTDQSLEICQKLTKNYSHFKIITQKNKGVSAARNMGVKYSTGEYYLFLDADDEFDSDMCEKMYDVAKTNQADLVIFGIKVKEFDGSIHYINNTGIQEIWNKHDALSEILDRKRLNSGVHTKLISKSIVKKISFEDGRKINEDKYFLFQSILLAKKIVYCDHCKYLYIRRRGSASNSSYQTKYKDMIYFSNKILNQITEYDPSLIFLAYADLEKSLLFVFRKLCKKRENKMIYHSDYYELKNKIKKLNYKKSKKLKLINRLEIIVIKLFGDLYFYVISFIYHEK